MERITGCIVDSAPVAAPDPQVNTCLYIWDCFENDFNIKAVKTSVVYMCSGMPPPAHLLYASSRFLIVAEFFLATILMLL